MRLKVSFGVATTFLLLVAVPLMICRFEKYLRDAHAAKCTSILRLIDHGKSAWAGRSNATNGQIVTWQDIQPYLWGEKVRCPSGGAYILNPIGVDPECSHGGDHAYLTH